MANAQRAFTTRYGARVRVLQTIATFFPAMTEEEVRQNPPPTFETAAVWDTGATGTVITRKVAEALGLKPIGVTEVNHAAGSSMMNEYLVNVALPNGVIFQGVRVTEASLAGIEALIGMDIIASGDFAVTHCNENGGTTLSFCVPSAEEIDFVPRANQDIVRKEGNRQQRRAIKKKKRR